MIGHELAIKQGEAPDLQPRHQPGKRNLRCVPFPAEHAFPEKGTPQRYAVKPADQPAARPAFDAVCMADGVKTKAGILYLRIDPAFRPVVPRRPAGADHLVKGTVGSDGEAFGANHLLQRFRHVETVERQDRAPLRFDPEDIGIIPAVRHGKYTHGIGTKQQR